MRAGSKANPLLPEILGTKVAQSPLLPSHRTALHRAAIEARGIWPYNAPFRDPGERPGHRRLLARPGVRGGLPRSVEESGGMGMDAECVHPHVFRDCTHGRSIH